MRREKKELRRGAESFSAGANTVKQIVGLGLIPLLRRLCLLRHVLNDVPLPFEDITNKLLTTQQSSMRNAYEHASMLAAHLGYSLDAFFYDVLPDGSVNVSQSPSRKNSALNLADDGLQLLSVETPDGLRLMAADIELDADVAMYMDSDKDDKPLFQGGALSAAKNLKPYSALSSLLEKLDGSLSRWKKSGINRAVVEFIPTLNQKPASAMGANGFTPSSGKMPHIRPKFAKRSLYVRLPAKGEFNRYPVEYMADGSSRPTSVLIDNASFFLEFHLLGELLNGVRWVCETRPLAEVRQLA